MSFFWIFYFILAEGEYDAAEIDKELISARLKQDVLDNSGKVHLFIADSVCDIFIISFHLLIFPCKKKLFVAYF